MFFSLHNAIFKYMECLRQKNAPNTSKSKTLGIRLKNYHAGKKEGRETSSGKYKKRQTVHMS